MKKTKKVLAVGLIGAMLLLVAISSCLPVSAVEASIGVPFIVMQQNTELRLTFRPPFITYEFNVTWYHEGDFTLIPNYKPAQGYKLVVLNFTVENLGTRETPSSTLFGKWEMQVDTGCMYGATSPPDMSNIMPTKSKSWCLVFEIPQDTNPVQVCYRSMFRETEDWDFILSITPSDIVPEFSSVQMILVLLLAVTVVSTRLRSTNR